MSDPAYIITLIAGVITGIVICFFNAFSIQKPFHELDSQLVKS